jgi:hypothetical protein
VPEQILMTMMTIFLTIILTAADKPMPPGNKYNHYREIATNSHLYALFYQFGSVVYRVNGRISWRCNSIVYRIPCYPAMNGCHGKKMGVCWNARYNYTAAPHSSPAYTVSLGHTYIKTRDAFYFGKAN